MSTSSVNSTASQPEAGTIQSSSPARAGEQASAHPVSAPAPAGQTLETRVFNELVDFLYRQSKNGRLTPTICFLVCAPLFLPHVGWWTLLVILAFQLGGTGICELLRRGYDRLQPGDDRRWHARAYAAASGICGMSWGLVGALWYVPDRPELQLVQVVLILGGITGSLVTRAPYLPALWVFVFAVGVPFIGALLAVGTPSSMTIAALGPIYSAGIFGWGYGLNAMYAREAAARLKNGDLVHDIEAARAEAEQRAEEANAGRQAAEAGARTKTQFLSTISHEVRTPLNGILGMADLLGQSDLTEDQRNCLSIIRESSDNLRVILEDVLDLARLDAGVAETVQEEFAPDQIALQVAAIMEPEIKRKKLVLDVFVVPGAPARVTGDEKRCRQALLNLLGNAVKFTDEGKISIRICVEEGGLGTGRDSLRFAVRDTGIGIPAEMIDGLFDDFFQVDQSSTRRHGGSGLGLALVNRIVTQMGGHVGVRSTLGEGSEFWFDMPLDASGIGSGRSADGDPPVAALQSASANTQEGSDNSQITRLETAIGVTKTRDIVESSIRAALQLTGTIDAARREGDAAAVARAAHDLRSTAGNIGLTELQGLAERIETAKRSGDDALVLEAAAHIPSAFAAARTQLAARYPLLDESLWAS